MPEKKNNLDDVQAKQQFNKIEENRDKDSRNKNTDVELCHCLLPSVEKICRSEPNKGRKYIGCQKFPQNNCCRFFKWHDEGEGI